MVKKLSLLFQNNAVFVDTFIVTVGSFIGSLFSYILQLYLGRSLSISAYGEFNTLLSLLTITTIPVVSLNTALVKYISELIAKKDDAVIAKLFASLSRLLLYVGVAFGLLLVLFSKQVSVYFKLHDINLLYIFALYIFFAFISSLPIVFLQGMLKFKTFTFVSLLATFLRLAMPFTFVYLGYGVNGVFAGMLVGSVISYVVGVLFLKFDKSETTLSYNDSYAKQIWLLTRSFLLINIGFVMLNNIDILLVKHYFSINDAGIYTAVVTLGKIVFFSTSTVPIVMLPKVSSAFVTGKDFYKEFKKFMQIQLLLLLPIATVFIAFPSQVVNIFFPKFSYAVSYVPLFTVFISIYVLVNFMITFLLSINYTTIWRFLIVFAVLQAFAISLLSHNLYSVIYVNTAIVIALFACLLIYFRLFVKKELSIAK